MGYKTMQGREIDLDKLMSQNELMPAIGNMKVNARGDELGPGGQIIRKREDVVAAYYEDNPNARVNPAPVVQEEVAVAAKDPAPAKQSKKLDAEE
jgi:hypothetical protein